MNVLLWNVDWAGSARKVRAIQEQIAQHNPAVVCLTEATSKIFAEMDHVITSSPDYGYDNRQGRRRKVALSSRFGWSQIDDFGNAALPPGRFVAGVTQGIRFIGICIPWSMAHVTTGRRDRRPWSEHYSFLRGLREVLQRYALDPEPICLLGDFNQRFPSRNHRAFHLLQEAMDGIVTLRTQGLQNADGLSMIDHIAASPTLSVRDLMVIPRMQNQRQVSDHDGLVASVIRSSLQ